MSKTYTIHGVPELPEGYGPEIHWGTLPLREEVQWPTSAGDWMSFTAEGFAHGMYVRKAKPWYPEEWYDPLTGELLPDVYEHTPGEWPKCRPKDEVDYLHRGERTDKCFCEDTREAINLEWDDEHIVAYRIVKRVKV